MQPLSSVHASASPCRGEHSHDGSSCPRVRPMRLVWYTQPSISSNVRSAAAFATGRSSTSCGIAARSEARAARR